MPSPLSKLGVGRLCHLNDLCPCPEGQDAEQDPSQAIDNAQEQRRGYSEGVRQWGATDVSFWYNKAVRSEECRK